MLAQLSLCGMVNMHTAACRMLLLNLANYNQFQRELISERTRDAMQHRKVADKGQGGHLYYSPS